ncbi:FMN-binding negative transcriptional regulator [Lacicoccus alkaliphilus]|uniref:Negative transcriptional regulator, PaiB family n=1 Tax=Lacicoccus alkaliphilus DSM 16010 TaxID=1123231 RepID=A0A1M7E363_9BACL|nr:FMN-binding negative transcriptional regulator [Salinicoccus alkaliphilus]SHL86201.1 negative transcriptional regulator, PaiB family [Salinicoccus alkaliphilus DSM 16010]
MYIPKHFKVDDPDEIKSFIEKNGFGTIITVNNGKPQATHTPMMLQEDEAGEWTITGHISKGNDQWKSFDDHENTLIMFQGPHAYISSTWYEDENVPTWNYQSVQLYGHCTLLGEDELRQDMIRLLDQYEGHDPDGATWQNLSENPKKKLKGIAGFKVKVEAVHAAYKMSQNRTDADYQNIVDALDTRAMGDDEKISREMKWLRK